MKKMRKETVTDSFACAFSASCSYDAVKAQAEQETAAFQRELERQAEALRQELKRQEKRAAHQREKERKAKEQEFRERELEKKTLERKTRNAEEKYFKCPACGCSFKLTRGWFLNKKEFYQDINFFKANVYKEHTCPYCKSVVRLETGEIRYIIKKRYINSNNYYTTHVSKQQFLFEIKHEIKHRAKETMKSTAKIAAIASVAGVLICLSTFVTAEISDKIKTHIQRKAHRNIHTNMAVEYIGQYNGILDNKGNVTSALGFYNESEDKIYWCEGTESECYATKWELHLSLAYGDTLWVSRVSEVEYYPNRSEFILDGHKFREIKTEEIPKEKVRSMCEWKTTGYVGEGAPKWCFMDVYENGDVRAENFYNLSKEGKFHSSYRLGTDGHFTTDEATEIWTMFMSLDKQKYEPYHANEDGLMVTEYQPYTVKVLFDMSDYEFQKSRHSKMNPSDDYSKDRCKYYALTEEDYNELISQFENMQNAVEKQSEKE